MREEVVRVFGFLIFGIVITLGLLAIAHLLSETRLSGQDGAAWVQAIGSIAAIYFALRVANRDAVERRDEKKTNARITAIGFIPELHDVTILLTRCQDDLQRAGEPQERVRAAVAHLELVGWAPEKLSALRPLKDGRAENLAETYADLLYRRAFMKMRLRHHGEPEQFFQLTDEMANDFARDLARLSARFGESKYALEREVERKFA